MNTYTWLMGTLSASLLTFSAFAQVGDQHGPSSFLEQHEGVTFFKSRNIKTQVLDLGFYISWGFRNLIYFPSCNMKLFISLQ